MLARRRPHYNFASAPVGNTHLSPTLRPTLAPKHRCRNLFRFTAGTPSHDHNGGQRIWFKIDWQKMCHAVWSSIQRPFDQSSGGAQVTPSYVSHIPRETHAPRVVISSCRRPGKPPRVGASVGRRRQIPHKEAGNAMCLWRHTGVRFAAQVTAG